MTCDSKINLYACTLNHLHIFVLSDDYLFYFKNYLYVFIAF